MSTRHRNEDLFEDTRMSFGEHIEELRKCLMRALYGLGVACIFGFIAANHIINFLQDPLQQAIRKFEQEQAKEEIVQQRGFFDPEFPYWMNERQMVPRTVHVERQRLSQIAGNQVSNEDMESKGFAIREGRGHYVSRVLNEPGQARTKDLRRYASGIRAQLNDQEKKLIARFAKKDRLGLDEREQLEQILKRIAVETDLYTADGFSKLTSKPDKGWLSRLFTGQADAMYATIKNKIEETDDPSLAVKLNRALVLETFPSSVTPPHANLVAIEIWEKADVKTQSLTPHDPFMVWMKAGVFGGLVLSGPWILFQLWVFVSAGLYPHEKRYVYWYVPISILLFFAGVALAFFFVLAPVLNFLLQFNERMGISPQVRINYWLSFVMYLPIGFGVAFQLPLVMLVLNRIGILDISAYLNKWRIAVMVIFVVSMLLTPADPLSMILLAVPLTALYFLGIALCKWMPRTQNPFGEVYEPT